MMIVNYRITLLSLIFILFSASLWARSVTSLASAEELQKFEKFQDHTKQELLTYIDTTLLQFDRSNSESVFVPFQRNLESLRFQIQNNLPSLESALRKYKGGTTLDAAYGDVTSFALYIQQAASTALKDTTIAVPKRSFVRFLVGSGAAVAGCAATLTYLATR